ncbi:hypothetical protein BBJ28_00025076 [Nothophytophthora sp. Chile5]|nr:hypothetical protein BBJ28_00025076 [Nothophytophthora sp. Chile5]
MFRWFEIFAFQEPPSKHSITNLLRSRQEDQESQEDEESGVYHRNSSQDQQLKMLESPVQQGDALLGYLAKALVDVADHLIPAVHKIVNWDYDDSDLGPIVPVR